MRIVVAVLVLLLVVAAGLDTARADGQIRTVGAGARTIGCTSSVLGCEGIASLRFGPNVIDVGWLGREGNGPLVMVQLASRPEGGLVRSQIIAGAGYRWTRGRGWLQGGPALAVTRLGERNARASSLLADDAALAVIAEGGVMLAWGDVPLAIALDIGTTFDAPELYQVLASITAYVF